MCILMDLHRIHTTFAEPQIGKMQTRNMLTQRPDKDMGIMKNGLMQL